MRDRSIPVNEEEAEKALEAIESDVVQNLVRMAVGQARLSLIKTDELSTSQWQASLPLEPFDMAFFVRVLAEAFRNEDSVRRVVSGESVAKATGWDF